MVDFHKRILFSDEAHFWLNGYVNKQNCHIWREANPQVYVETPLHPEKLTVWCALWAADESLEEFAVVDEDNVCSAPIMAGKDIFEFVHSSKNIMDSDSDDEKEIYNAAPVPASSEIRNIMKRRRSYIDEAARIVGLSKSEDFINEVLDAAASVMNLNEKERQKRILERKKELYDTLEKGPTPAGLLKSVKRFDETGKLEDGARAGRPCLKCTLHCCRNGSDCVESSFRDQYARKLPDEPPSSVRNILRRMLYHTNCNRAMNFCQQIPHKGSLQDFSKMEQDISNGDVNPVPFGRPLIREYTQKPLRAWCVFTGSFINPSLCPVMDG
ncbi:hypothetical protein TNCV_2476301 [Trichonephila clavipes]|nr:hypothetical protein TNCV_2476301 [Trichonephila clavipes]